MSHQQQKYWTVGEIDATGVRGPHEVELRNISRAKYPLFINIDKDYLKNIVENELGGKIWNLGFNEDWTITLEMFPEVNIHLIYTFFGKEFGDEIEAEFKFLFSGERAYWIPGEDTATYIDLIMDFLERKIKNREPFEKDFANKTDLMRKVLLQRSEPFKLLEDTHKDDLAEFLGAKVWRTMNGWKIKKEAFPEIFIELNWDGEKLDISYSGQNLHKNISSYHVELIGIFLINHILRFITLTYHEKEIPDICFIMFSRMFTKEKNWEHRRK
ncbi:MAG: hypothetical protein ACFE9R_04430 [Candidatus Hermodarchaeota archaeon]